MMKPVVRFIARRMSAVMLSARKWRTSSRNARSSDVSRRSTARSPIARKSHPAGARAGIGGREMHVHHAPGAVLLADHHGRAGDELRAVVVDIARRRLLAGPYPFGLAV